MLGFGAISAFPLSAFLESEIGDGGNNPSDEGKSEYATGELVHNIVPILFVGGFSFVTDGRYQAVENYSYTSGPDCGISPFGTHPSQRYTLDGGAMPPGLSLEMATGIISGTVDTIFTDDNLTKLIEAYPDDEISMSEQDGGGTYKLRRPSKWDTYYTVEKTYNFSVQGWDPDPSSGNPIIGAKVNFSITVLKTWDEDVKNYNELPLETRLEIGKKDPQT